MRPKRPNVKSFLVATVILLSLLPRGFKKKRLGSKRVFAHLHRDFEELTSCENAGLPLGQQIRSRWGPPTVKIQLPH